MPPPAKPTKAWFIRNGERAPAGLIEAYAGQSSVSQGDELTMHVSTSAPTWSADVFRIGDYDGQGGTRVARLGPFTANGEHGVKTDRSTRATSANWPVSARLDTANWGPGFYLIHAIASGKRTEVPLTVRSPNAQDAVAVIGSATTWQAYNLWGGRSLYRSANGTFADRSYAVSFDRPFDKTGRTLLYAFEIPIMRVAEESGVPVAWATNVDIAEDPAFLTGAAGAVSTGHDEYWPIPYRNALAKLRDAGGNLAFMGANSGYWRVRLDDSPIGANRVVTCYKSAELDPVKNSPRTTVRWRDQPDPVPENTVIGQLYDAFPVNGPMHIDDPDYFLFKGTGVREGSQITGLIGPETDRYYLDKTAPKEVQLPAISPVICRGKQTWSTMSYYAAPSGAGVVAMGTMGWSRSLPRPKKIAGIPQSTTAFAHQVTLNTFAGLAAGPMARANPVNPDLAAARRLPKTNTSGAA